MTSTFAEETVQFEPPVSRIAPPRGWLDIDFKELWGARELLYFFVWRDIKVRYKQTAIGAAWAVIQPFMTMVVFSLFLRKTGQNGFARPALSRLLLQRPASLDLLLRRI